MIYFLDFFRKTKRQFDVNNEDDVECYKQFYTNRRWAGGCPFELDEDNYDTIPEMINDKIIKKFLNIKE